MEDSGISKLKIEKQGAPKPKGPKDKDRLWWAVAAVTALFMLLFIARLIVGGIEVKVLPMTSAEQSPFLTVPSSAIVEKDGGAFVFIEINGRAGETQVTTGRKTGGDVEVLAGLKQGDRVIINPPKGLPSGARVKVTEE